MPAITWLANAGFFAGSRLSQTPYFEQAATLFGAQSARFGTTMVGIQNFSTTGSPGSQINVPSLPVTLYGVRFPIGRTAPIALATNARFSIWRYVIYGYPGSGIEPELFIDPSVDLPLCTASWIINDLPLVSAANNFAHNAVGTQYVPYTEAMFDTPTTILPASAEDPFSQWIRWALYLDNGEAPIGSGMVLQTRTSGSWSTASSLDADPLRHAVNSFPPAGLWFEVPPEDGGGGLGVKSVEWYLGYIPGETGVETRVFAWGNNGAGALGDGTTTDRNSPVPQITHPGFIQVVTAGESASFGLTGTGVVYHWGANNGWEMGTGTSDFADHPVPTVVAGLPPIIHIVGTRRGCFALTATGDLYCWGDNSSGAFGIGAALAHTPTLSTSNVSIITASLYNTTIVLSSGEVQSCGDNTLGGVGDGTTTDRDTWTTIDPVPGKQVVASACYVQGQYVLMGDGTVYGVGCSTSGQLGVVTPGATTTWTQIPVAGVEAIHATGGTGQGAGFFVLSDGTTWALGSNYRGLLGAGLDPVSTPFVSTPVQVGFPPGVRPLQFGGPGSITTAPIARGSDSRVYTWGDGEFGAMGDSLAALTNTLPIVNPSLSEVVFVGGGRNSQFARASNAVGLGANYSWGTNTASGLMGTGDTADHLSPTPMATTVPVTQFATAFQGSSTDAAGFALSEDGLVYSWGGNGAGQLGNGTTDSSAHSTPVLVAGLSDIVKLRAGNNDVYALTSSGDLYAWGFNQVGQLGLGHVSPVLTPTLIATGVADVAEGGTQSIILFLDGTVQTAGGNSFGQLGIGTADGANHPNRHTVFPGAGVVAVRATIATTYLLYADGTVKGWGFSNTGQLGIISSINTALMTVPISNVAEIGCGGQQAFFLLNDGTAWAIGSNTDGVLGVGQNFTDLNLTTTSLQMLWPVGVSPVQFGSGINNNTTIAMMLAIGSDGRVYTWGSGDSGQMGDGLIGAETNHTPVSVNGLSAIGTVGGGYTTMWAAEGEAGGGTTPLSGHARSYAQIIG